MSTVSSSSYYDILGILAKASDQEIKAAYKKKAITSHPDKAAQNNLTTEQATEAFKLVNEAYEVLSNPQKRDIYDKSRSSKVYTSNSTSFTPNTNFYEEPFDFFTHFYGSNPPPFYSYKESDNYNQKKAEEPEPIFFPELVSEEANRIINEDNIERLDQFLKNKNNEIKLLKSVFYRACRSGKFNIVKYFIEVRKLSPNLRISDGISLTGPIFKAAAESGNLELVKYLFEIHHVDIESKGLTAGTQSTALSEAVSHGHLDVVEYLISKGANLNPKVSYSNILECAISSNKLSIVMMLVEAGTKIGDFDLDRALEKGNLDIVQYLLQKRPGIKAHQHTSSPACLAVRSGNVALVKYLEEKEGLNIFEGYRSWDDSIDLLMKAAAKSGSIEMMKFLLDERGLNEKVSTNTDYIQSILSEAVKHGSYPPKREKEARVKFIQFLMEERQLVLPKEKFKRLISDCANFSSIEINSYLQRYLCGSSQFKDILLIIANQGLKALSITDLWKLYNSKLIKKGACGDFGFEISSHIQERKVTPEQLQEVCLGNKQAMEEALFCYSSFYFKDDVSPLKLLLELGVNLNAENAEGIAAIHIALRSEGYNKIVQFYVDNKADLSKKNKNGQTAAEILAKKLQK